MGDEERILNGNDLPNGSRHEVAAAAHTITISGFRGNVGSPLPLVGTIRCMSHDFALVLVSSDEICPVERAQALIEPFLHQDDCLGTGQESCENHLWSRAFVGGPDYDKEGCLWRDRYGKLPEDHSITGPSDEIRKVSDVDLRATFLAPMALILPDGQIHEVSMRPHPFWAAEYAACEDRLAEYPECYAVPFRCRR